VSRASLDPAVLTVMAPGGEPPVLREPAQPPVQRRGRGWHGVLPPLAVLAVVVAVIYPVSYSLPPRQRFQLPPPHEVIRVSFLDAGNRRDLVAALGLSAQVALTGLLIAMLIGFVLAVLMSQARWAERSLFPYAVILQSIPILALVPLIAVWLDYGFRARVTVCVLIALFPIIANTLFGLKSAEAGQHDLFTLHGASRWTRLIKLQLPAAMPAAFAGLRIAAGLAVVGAVVGDFFFRQGQPGIGILIDVYRARLQGELLFGAAGMAALLGVAVFWAFGLLNDRVVGRWHDSGRPDRT